MNDLFSVEGKIAIVTGATSGIGRMIAGGLVERGARTYVVGRDPQACATVVAELDGRGDCRALPGDLATLAGVAALVAAFAEREIRLDILVNCAGAMYDAPLDEFTEEGWDSVVDLNLKSVFFLSQGLLPHLRDGAAAGGLASIVNIGSVGGLRVGNKENYSYQAAKAGLHHLTGSLARRLAPENIVVNAIAPGFFPSRLTRVPDSALPGVLAAVPRRRLGTADDIVAAVVYLSSRAASYVSGAVIPLAGGMTL